MVQQHRRRIFAAKARCCVLWKVHLDQIHGCMFGGAVGDTLGYPVEFMQETEIFERYWKPGISSYRLVHMHRPVKLVD